MTLGKTSFFVAISTGIKIITLFIISKMIAIYVGPAGLAIIGQLQNFVSIVLLPKAYFWIKHQYTIDIKQQHPISPMSYCNR